MEYLVEAAIIALSSAGVFGAVIAALISKAFKNARADADRRRDERYESEMMRSEFEELSGELLLTLARNQRGLAGNEELREAEERFAEFSDKMKRLNRQRYLHYITAK